MKVQRCCATDSSMKIRLEEEVRRQLEDIPNEESLEENSKILHALSHPLRLKIAFLLLKRDHCVCELVQLTRKKSNLVSHHLAIMRKSGVVDAYIKSPWKYYKLNESAARILKELKKLGYVEEKGGFKIATSGKLAIL